MLFRNKVVCHGKKSVLLWCLPNDVETWSNAVGWVLKV